MSTLTVFFVLNALDSVEFWFDGRQVWGLLIVCGEMTQGEVLKGTMPDT